MPRARRPGLLRMDAAVDAMAPFGFPAKKVKKHVNLLLKVYGGDDGWPFIEEYSYKELIEALLRDEEENRDEQVVKDDNQPKETPLESKTEAGTSTNVSETQQDGHSDHSDHQLEASSSMTNQDEPKTPTNGHLPCKRQPCYGWIESDDEDVNDFIFLKPASSIFCGKGEARSRLRRRSRWDLRPEDP